AEAKTDAQGLARFDSLPSDRDVPSCHSLHYSPYLEGLLVVAAVDGDLGFVHTSWSEGIEPWRFKLPTTWRPETLKAHSVLDRSLLRAGDTLHMKHVLRRAVQAGFAQVPPPERPEKLEIVHVGTDERWELPLSWGPDGAAVNEWTIPREAKLGGYELRMRAPGKKEWEADVSATFRVEEFRVPLMRALIKPPKEAQVSPREVPLDLAVQFLSGGGASGLPVRVRTQIRKRSEVSFEEYPEFEFARGGVKPGVRTRRFGQGELDWEREWDWGEGGELGLLWRTPEEPGVARTPVSTQELVLDAAGTQRAVLKGLPRAEEPLELVSELEYRDPNGEVQTAARTIALWPAARVVGLRTSSWADPGQPLPVRTVVLGLDGRPVWLAKVEVDAFERRTYSTRK